MSARSAAALAPMKSGFKVPDIRLRMDQTFLKKPNIKAADVEIQRTMEQELEYVKAASDAEYFAKNFYKITSIDKGFILFDMYKYQEELFQAFQENRFNISLQARQSGKCVHHDTQIKLKKVSTDEILEMSIGEFHHQIVQENGKRFTLDDSPMEGDFNLSNFTKRKFEDSFTVIDFEIWTDSGWEPLESSHVTVDYDVWYLETEGGKTLHCADDHIVFKNGSSPIQKYVKNLKAGHRILTETGVDTVKFVFKMGYGTQMYDLQVGSNNHRYYTGGILSHNTTVVAAFILWFAMFHPDKDIAILANKEKQAKEVLSRISKSYLDMPFFLQRGCRKYGSTEIEFDNGSRIRAFATTPESIRGNSVALLYIDEVAFVENDMEFWESTLPTLASAKSSRAILTSTPKGERGLFHKIWKEAEPDENGETNGFHRTKVAWYDVPPYAEDPNWEPSERRRIGDARFEQEYNCSFKGSSNTLIQNKYLEKMITKRPIDEISEFTKIFSKYDEEHRYVAVADVGGGVGKDYSVLTVFDVTEYPFRIAAKYRNNKISPLMFPHTIISMCKEYGNCPVLVETNNDVGGQAITVLWYEMEYEETIMTSVDQKRAGAGIRIGGRMGKPGIKTTSRVRNIGCSNLKTLIEQNQLIIEDLDTIQELGTFIDTGTRFEADKGCHDDCVMTLVLFSWLTKQEWFVDLFEKNVSDNLMKTSTQKSIEEMMPFGGINRGSIGGSARTVKVSPAGRKMKVQEGGSLEEWMKS